MGSVASRAGSRDDSSPSRDSWRDAAASASLVLALAGPALVLDSPGTPIGLVLLLWSSVGWSLLVVAGALWHVERRVERPSARRWRAVFQVLPPVIAVVLIGAHVVIAHRADVPTRPARAVIGAAAIMCTAAALAATMRRLGPAVAAATTVVVALVLWAAAHGPLLACTARDCWAAV